MPYIKMIIFVNSRQERDAVFHYVSFIHFNCREGVG